MDIFSEPASAGTPPACLPPHLNKPRLRRKELPEYLEIMFGIELKVSTFERYASAGGGPSFQKSGRVPLYPREHLDAWALARLGPMRRSTSEG